MSTTLAGGTSLTQQRHLVTEIPGPRSQEKLARKKEYVADGVGTTLPVFVEAAGGGVIRRRRRQLADRPRLRHRRDHASATPRPRVVERVQRAGRGASPTPASWSRRTTATSRSASSSPSSPPATTRRSRRCSTPAPRPSRTPSRSPASRTGRDAVVVFDHAYHGRTNLTMAMTAKNMPYKHGFGPFAGEVYRVPMSYPFRETGGITGEDAAARAIDHAREAGRRRQPRLRRDRADPRRGRLRRPGRRASCRALAAWCRDNGVAVRRRRDPDRLLPHRRLVRLRPRGRRARPDHHGQGHRRRPAAGRASPAAPRSWTPSTPAASAARTAATRSPAPPRSARSTR